MIFSSQIFLFWFLPLALLSYYAAPARLRSFQLVLASYAFYGWWRVDFTLLMLASTVIDFYCGGAIGRLGDEMRATRDADVAARLARRRKRFLLLSIAVNLGALGYFKYMNFGVDSLRAVLAELGFAGVTWPEVILPIGISFYTFQTMSYSIDVYRGAARHVDRFIDFACYVAMFPQLVAGPIVRYQTLAEQLVSRTHTLRKLADGALYFQIGLVKKVLLADSVGEIADRAYALSDPSTLEAWTGTFAYAFQIYFDFSGYSDMAIGLGLMFGFVFPSNFESPYKSESITEFWRRWHISLSSWLRDYLYLPLGGNRRGPGRTYVNLMVTMLLGGLWHGAAWTFLAWGAYQGAWLAFERKLGKRSLYGRAPRPLRIALTFVIALGGWVFFRAVDVSQAADFLAAMAGFAEPSASLLRFEVDRLHLTALAAGAAVVWLAPNSRQLVERRAVWFACCLGLLFPLAIVQLFFESYSPFLYFQF